MLDVPGKNDLPPYHVTVAYFGKMSEVEDRERRELISTVYDVCRRHPPMVLKIGGFGVFTSSDNSEGKSPLIYTVDTPGLAELHTDLTRALKSILPVKQDHGFVPHVTVGYLPEGKSLSHVRVPDVRYPDWTIHSVEVIFGDIPVEIQLGGEDLQRSLSALPVFIDLHKARGRKKGSKNKTRRYLMRLELPGKDAEGNPRYEYIYPDVDEIESWHPQFGFTIKPKPGAEKPRSIQEIINDHLFGSYGVHTVKDKSGNMVKEPWWKDGFFYAYAPDEPPKPGEKRARSAYGYLNRDYGTPIDKDMIGKIRFNKYQRRPGFVSYDLGAGVERKYNYKIPQKILNLQITDEASLKQAEAATPGHGIREGAKPGKEQPRDTDTAPLNDINIHAVPARTEQSENALSEPIDNTVDPLVYMQRVMERAGKKKQTEVPSHAKVLPFPQEAIDEFGSEGELLDELRNRPATTMVTLGKYNAGQRKVQAQLLKEWGGYINGLARDAFRYTYRLTGRYRAREEEDAAQGFTAGGGAGIRSYRKEVMDDLIQQGKAELFELANDYAQGGWVRGEKPRFDQWVYPKLKGRIQDYSKKQAISYEGGVPEHLVEEHEIDEAARHQGYTVEMSPEEAAELSEVRRKAKAALLKVLHSKKLPEAYRRVFLARHYLDSPESIKLEADTIDKRREQVGGKKELSYQTRPFTGEGSIAETYPEWTDPKGKKISFTGMNQTAQLYHLNKWYEQAQAEIYRKFTKPTVNDEGEVNEDERVLTTSGKAVRDWLTLEAKLAAGNRRLYEDREQHERILVHEKIPTAPPSSAQPKPKETPIQKPAIAFFAGQPELATRLGVDLGKLDLTSGLHQGTAAQHHLDVAERFHNTLLGMKEHSPQKLTSRITTAEKTIAALDKLHNTHLDKLHQATAEYQRHGHRLLAAGAQLREDRRAYAKQKHSVQMVPKNPIKKKDDPVGYEAFNHVVKIGNIRNHTDLESGIRDYILTHQDRWPGAARGGVLKQFIGNVKKEFIKVGAVKLGESKAKVAEFKKRQEAIQNDKEYKAARQKVTRISNKVAEVKVGDVPIGANIVQAYAQALKAKQPITTEHLAPHKAAVHSALRGLEGELELLKFERNQRKVVKSIVVPADRPLFKAFGDLGSMIGLLWKNDAKPAHHKAYQRRSKSGKISQIKAKGWQPAAVQPKPKENGRPTAGAGAQLPQELRDRLKALGVGKLPAAHISDIVVHDRVHSDEEAHTGALLKWRDDSGMEQKSYSTEFDRRNAEKKWARILANRPKVEEQMDQLRSKVLESPAHAAAFLIALTGLRPGSSISEKRTGHFGATTMQVQHLKFEGEGEQLAAHISYIGKNAKHNQAMIDDPILVKALQALTLGKKPDDRVFTCGIDSVRKALPKGVKVKDLRTILATSTAETLLKDHVPKLSGKDDAKSEKADARQIVGILKAVSTAVSKKLNNTPAMARKSYIAPQVIRAWGETHGIKAEWLA